MKTENQLLEKGIETLCQNDKDIEKLISPRMENVLSLLERYKNEIELFNSAYGLVGTNDSRELVVKHLLDSLAPLGIISRLLDGGKTGGRKIADAGSGAGLPGIPLAVSLPDCDFTLIERMARRANFLCNTKAVLNLSNVTVEERELESVQSGLFSLITFRAFKPLEPKLLKNLFKTCTQDGIIAAYKGRREKTEQEISQLGETSCKAEIISYTVPFLEEERHLLVLRQDCHCALV